jgi:glutamyl-tRNA reductase
MVLGETEILGQLKVAYETARQHQHTAAELNKAFQSAFHVAKRIRTETDIQRGNISVASVSVQLADRIFESLRGQRVLIIGAGDTSEKTLRALVSRGVKDVRIANRTVATAEALAAEYNGKVVPFEQWPDQLEQVDIVVSSTAAPGYILDAARLTTAMKQRRNSPLLLIDLAVPRDIDPEANQMNDVYLYNVDDLRSIADDHLLHRKAELDRCESIIREQVAEVLEGKRRRANALRDKRPAMGT